MKLITKFSWYHVSIASGTLSQICDHWDIQKQEYRFLDNSGYGSEQNAIDALLNFIGNDVYRYEEFTLFKTYKVVSD